MQWTSESRGMLDDLVHTMRQEELISDQFSEVQAKKATIRPDYVVQAITNYCSVSQGLLDEMSRHITQTEINFLRINIGAHDLYAKSSSIGAERVKKTCVQLMRACQEKNKEGCYSALIFSKAEFSELRKRFDKMLQLERKVLEEEHADRLD